MVRREILLRALDTIKENLSYSSIRKAERLFNNGNIRNVGCPQNSTAGVVDAIVEGDHSNYRVEFAYNNEMNIWEHRCSCPTRRRYCSHILVLLLYISNEILQENRDSEILEPADSLYDYLRSYTNDRSNLPIRGIMFGLEVEFKGISDIREKARVNKFWKNNHTYMKELFNRGWRLKRDSTVDFEFVSPVSDKGSLLKDFEDFKILWEYWSEHSTKDAGIHIHCSMDDFFTVGKTPKSRTKDFLKDLAIYLEDSFIKTDAERIFGRDFTSYCKSWKSDGGNRFRWVNFLPLNRDVSKTIEFRIFSSTKANQIPDIVHKAYWLTILFRRALFVWRKEKTPSFQEWIKGRKLLETLFTNSEVLEFFKTFKPEMVKSVNKSL